MTKKKEATFNKRLRCLFCKKWLTHNQSACPLFPRIVGEKKTKECKCFIHKCYPVSRKTLRLANPGKQVSA